MRSNATEPWSRAPPCTACLLVKSVSARRNGSIQGGGERRFAAYERGPGELEPVPLALRYEFQSFGADGEHVGLLADLHLTSERFLELGCHVEPFLGRNDLPKQF